MAEGNLDISGLMSKIDDLVQMIDHRGTEVAVELNGTRQNLMWIGSQINAASTLSGGGVSASIDPNKLYQKIDELIRGVNGGREAMYATNEEIGHLKDLWTKFEKDENPKPNSGAGSDEKAQWLQQRRDKWLGLEGKEKNIMLNEGLIRPNDPIFSAKPDNGGMDEAELVKTWRQLGIDAREKLLEGLSYGKAKKLWDNETSDSEKGALFDAFQKKQRGGKSFAKEEDLTDDGKRARTHRKFEKIQEAEQQEKEAKAVSEKENGKKPPTAKQSFTKALAAKGGGNLASGVVNVLGDVADVVTDGIIAQKKKEQNTWMAQQDMYLKTLETGSKIFERKLKTFSKGMQGAMTSTFSGITQGVQEGAYAAASSSVDYAAESLANTFENTLDRFKLANYKAIRQQEAELENLKLTNQQINGAAGLIGGVVGMLPGLGSAIGGAITAIAKQTTKMLEATKELDFQKRQKEIEVKEKELEAITEAKNNAVSATQEAVSKVLDFSKSIETLSVKTDAAARSMGNIIGMSGANIQQFEDLIYKTARDLSFKDSSGAATYFNKTAEDMLKMQSGYIEASGRNIVMSKNDHIRAFQLGEVVGDDNLAAAMLGDMDYFNQTIEDSTDLIYKMFKQANKAGVSNRKFAKDLRDNLKLAQKYTFKGGAENLMKMSIWAQKTRFNMRDLETAIDKVQEGGLEGVIKQSAQLQVLGGNFAIHSDPLGMLFDAFADPDAYGHRLNSMLKGMGAFNKNTGQVDINPVEMQQLRAYANATGVSFTDARAQVTQHIKGNEIDKYLGDKKYNDRQKALIYSKAQWNKDTGEWQVTLDNGERVEDISNLREDDFTQLMPTEEAIEDYVSKIYSLLNQQGGATVHAQAVLSDETKDNLRANIEQRIADNLKFIDDNFATITKMVTDSNDFVTRQNKQQQDNMLATADVLNTQFSIIEGAVSQFTATLKDAGSDLRVALDAVKAQ